MPSPFRSQVGVDERSLLRVWLVWGAFTSILMTFAIGLTGCGSGEADETSDRSQTAEQKQRERRQARQTPDAQGKSAKAKAGQPKTNSAEPNAQNKEKSQAPGQVRVVATPWSEKDLGEWTMLDYENAVKNSDVKFVQALDRFIASDVDDNQKVQQIAQILLLVSTMPDGGRRPDLFDPSASTGNPPANRNSSSGSSRRGDDDDD